MSKENLHVNQYLTNISVGYKNAELIADQVLPVVPVAKESDKYVVFGRQAFMLENDLRANGSESARVTSYSVGTASYTCVTHALNDIVTDRDRANADAPIVPDRETTEGLTDKILLRREYDVASYLFNTTTFSGYTSALSGTNQWSDLSSSDPIGDTETAIDNIRQQIGRKPNVCVLGYAVWKQLKQHPDLLERIKYTQRGILTTEQVAMLFGVEKVLVGSAVYNSAAEGATESMADVWGKFVLYAYVTKRPTLKSPSVGYIPTWKIYGGKTAKVKKWREEKNDGDIIEVNWSYDIIATAARAGYLYSTAVA